MKVLGIDPSLTGTGLAAIIGGRPGQQAPFYTDRIARQVKGQTGLARIRRIVHNVEEWTHGVDLAVIEGPSYGSSGGGWHHELGGLWWALADMLDRREIPMAVVAPSARAKYATGRGNAGKDAVLAAVVRRYCTVDEIESNDEADAIVLAAMGARWLGQPVEASLAAANQAGLYKVSWPGRLDQ